MILSNAVDPEIDATLAVFFLGLGERREAARDERAHVPLVVLRQALNSSDTNVKAMSSVP